MRKIRVLLTIALLTVITLMNAQTIDLLLEKMETYSDSYPQEKLYLQLDKNVYSAGESIWFKSYATIGIYNLFSNVSGLAYVDLINMSGVKIDSIIIPLVMGIGLGDFVLPDTLSEGSYRLRAYTNWMRNAEDYYFYDRTLQVVNGRTDNIVTKTTLQPGKSSSNYLIDIKHANGVPIPNEKISYELIYDNKVAERKRISSDLKGRISINVDNKYKDGVINLQFTNPEKRIVKKTIKVRDAAAVNHVEVLPEGGKLLAGVLNTVGIKSINGQGLGEKVEVFFSNGIDTLASCMTNDLGMGACSLFLHNESSLQAYYLDKDGTQIAVDVPPIHTSGYALQVNNQNSTKVFAQLNVSEDLINGEDIFFVVHHIGKVFYLSKQKVNKAELFFSLDRDMLPSGVITITMLNSKFVPLTERPIFIYHPSSLLNLDIKSDKKSYGHREKVSIDLKSLSMDTVKAAALSASVLNVTKVHDNLAVLPNILSGLLLSSDLKGYIENPGYYFENNELKVADMDYLMLTQGWRNIDWSILGLTIPIKYVPEKALSISGYTKKLGRAKVEPGAKVQLISTQNYMDFMDTVSNEDGLFRFDNILFPDSVKYMITAKDGTKGKSNIDIVYNKPIMSPVGRNRNEPDELWDVNLLYKDDMGYSNKYLSELERIGLKEKSVQIEEVVVRARQEPKVAKNSSNLNGAGRADQIITAEDLSTCSSLEMCLAGRVMGVTWQGGIPYNTRGNVPMQVVLDGMFIEADQISSINVSDVESIEVLRNSNYTTIYGSNGANGVIVITSKSGEALTRNYTPKGIIVVSPKGIHMNKVFYAPKYDVSSGGIGQMADLRTLIHWEPSLVLDMTGEAHFSFYTADEKGTYLITIEGLDLYGRICHTVYTFEVH